MRRVMANAPHHPAAAKRCGIQIAPQRLLGCMWLLACRSADWRGMAHSMLTGRVPACGRLIATESGSRSVASRIGEGQQTAATCEAGRVTVRVSPQFSTLTTKVSRRRDERKILMTQKTVEQPAIAASAGPACSPSRLARFLYWAQWQVGVCHGRAARRNRLTGEVQFVLWKSGEYGHASDYWHRFDPSWWDEFVAG